MQARMGTARASPAPPPCPPARAAAWRMALMPAGLASFSALTLLLAVLALHPEALDRAGLWPHAYFLAISAQWGSLGLLCAGLCASGARPLLRAPGPWRGRWQGRGPALGALLLFHALLALASVLMGFADALVGGQHLPGYLVELLPREGQLLMLLAASWACMVLGAGFLGVLRTPGLPPRRHAAALVATLLIGAVAYWGWGWSRFYATAPGEWFSLWKVGALDIAVEGTIFQALLLGMPLVHAGIVAGLAAQLLRAPWQALEGREGAPRAS